MTDGSALEHVVDESLDEARYSDQKRVDHRFENYRPRQRGMIEATQERHLVGDQNDLADDQRRRGRDEEAGELDQVVFEDQPFGEEDEVEADEEEDRRRQDLAEFVEQGMAQPRHPPRRPRLDRGYGHGYLRDELWFACRR